jgi:hypothetical protein
MHLGPPSLVRALTGPSVPRRGERMSAEAAPGPSSEAKPGAALVRPPSMP